MLINFTVKNYRSFKDANTISLEPIRKARTPALPFTAVYGPNASGKSNILKAFEFMRFAMNNEDATNRLTVKNPNLQPFLLNKTGSRTPIMLEVTVFNPQSKASYRYGFEIQSEKIQKEWFIETALRNQRVTEREIYLRTGNNYTFDSSVPNQIRVVQETIPPEILAIKRFANNNMLQALDLFDLTFNKTIVFNCSNPQMIFEQAMQRLTEDPWLKDQVSKLIVDFNISIREFDVTRKAATEDQMAALPEQIRKLLRDARGVQTQVMTTHNVYNAKGEVIGSQKFDLRNDESLGTQNLLPFLTMLVGAMNNGLTILADEFGSGLHPFISSALVATTLKHSKNSQLIVFTHETYLLNVADLLKPEMIWFVDKNSREESNLVSLSEYKPRSDTRIEKQYLEGRFGAVPTVLRDRL